MRCQTQRTISGAIDRLEICVIGCWTDGARSSLSSLDLGLRTLAGKQVNICQGGKDGPDFYDFAIQRKKLFRIHVYKCPVNKAALKIICFSDMTSKYGGRRSRLIVKTFLRKLGFDWRGESVSRLDICVDIDISFNQFRYWIEKKRFVCRARSNNFCEHETTLYFGIPKSIQARIYDKAEESGLDSPLTRIEFMLRRRWLRENGLNKFEDIDLVELWARLTTKWLRITKGRPDGKHYDQLKNWSVWEEIQRFDEFL